MECPFEALEQAIKDAGVVFLMAPRHHSAMRHVGPVRAELGVRTIFNLLGPLSNPALVKRILVGSYDQRWLNPFAQALDQLGTEYAWIVHGADGLDELSTTGTNQITSLNKGKITHFTLHPSDLDLPEAQLDALRGGDAEYNAKALQRLLSGEKGPYWDIVMLNAAGALVAGGHETDLNTAFQRADKSLKEGAAAEALNRLVSITNGINNI